MSDEHEFHSEMVRLFDVASSLGYRPIYFLRTVQEHGGVSAARKLLKAPEAQSGLIKLWELGRLDISVEALVLRERWNSLFSDSERQAARQRLEAFDYDPSTSH